MRTLVAAWAVVFGAVACADSSNPAADGGPGDGGLADAGFSRCAPGSLTIDGTLEGARVEISLPLRGASAGGQPGIADRATVSFSGPGTVALGAVDREVSLTDTATGAVWLSSSEVLGGEWLCGTATISLTPASRSLRLGRVARLGACADLPAVPGEIELCSSQGQDCDGQAQFFRTTVADLPTPPSNGSHGGSGAAGVGVVVMGGVLAEGGGSNYYFAWKESPAVLLCAEDATVRNGDGTVELRLQRLHRAPICPNTSGAGELFVCAAR